jgi:NDP-sugar pyrophosphorylase family protein
MSDILHIVSDGFIILFSIQIGPNVSLSANARIGAGARLINCIILDDVEIMVSFSLFTKR